MDVTFFRHGIAVDRADPLAPIDAERPLTLEGKNRAEAAARGLRNIIAAPSLIVTSPYRRCLQTARILATAFGLQRRLVRELDALTPGSSPGRFWGEVAVLGHPRMLCVGHGGTLEPLAGAALGLLDPAAADIGREAAVYGSLHLKKGGALHLTVRYEPHLHARLMWLMTPKLLRQLRRS